jgi:ABC-type bacteriocin/lantibiotic exporter with double-glycine peptidase domain
VAVLVVVIALYNVNAFLEARIIPRFTTFTREKIYARYVHRHAGTLDTAKGYILAEIPWFTVYMYKCLVQTFLPMILVGLFFALFVFCMDPVSGGVVLVYLIVYSVVAAVLFRRIIRFSRERYHEEARALSWFEDVLNNTEYVLRNNSTSLEKRLLRKKQDAVNGAVRQEIKIISVACTILTGMLVVLALGLFFFCFWRMRRGIVSLGAFTFLVSGLVVMLIDALTVRFTRQALEQIDDIGPALFSKEPAGIVHKGTIGSGESTILRVLDGSLAPTSGSVTIDGAGIGVFCPAYLKTRIVRMTQKIEFFRRPFLENIFYPDRPGSERWKAKLGRYACIRDFIEKNKKTTDATRLSGGQKQLAMLVRIVLNDPVVLLLDEPTASAVAESKDIIRALLREVIRERTALCISHDKDIDDLFDRVVVLDNGRIRG